MGIRYYAYAFDPEYIAQALANPRAFISDDPLADAWGFPHHARVSTPAFEQAVPERDMLYLDKAWWHLQQLTCGGQTSGTPRAAYRMFEGQVTMCGDGWCPWYRTLTPADVADVAEDLQAVCLEIDEHGLSQDGADRREADYALQYLHAALSFVQGLAAEGRGMAYMIG